MSQLAHVVIVAAKRTPIGNFNGVFATVPAHQLGATVLKSVVQELALTPAQVSEVILGHVLTAGCGQNPARQAAIHAGLDIEVPSWGINQVCGSGLKAVALGFQSIACGQNQIVIAGGQENMTLAPHVAHLRVATKMGNAVLKDSMIVDGLWDAFRDYHMGITAENVAKKYGISRSAQDEFAYASQMKAATAIKAGLFKDEIVPVVIKGKKEDVTITQDEFPRADTTLEGLQALRPVFDREGTVTAGNASGLNDGAAALVLMAEETAHKLGLKVLARIVSVGQSGVLPEVMGTGPITASQMALQKAGWLVDQLDVIEANEAFAAQAIAVNQVMQWDLKKVNVNGGAIALGHPIGASGARILVTLIHQLKRSKGKRGLATLCIGGGMGIAMCVEI